MRLADGYISSIANVGRLEIYFNNRWGTFCGLSIGGAQAACMQMGFYNFVKYEPWYMTSKKVPSAEPDTPITISTTFCDRSFRGDVHHILRCGYSTDVPSSCNHTADIVLGCSTMSLWRYPYEMQVQKWQCFFLRNFRDLPQQCVGKYLLQWFSNCPQLLLSLCKPSGFFLHAGQRY